VRRAAAVWRNAYGAREAAPGKESLTNVVGYATMANGMLYLVRQHASGTLPVAVLSSTPTPRSVRQFTGNV